MKDREQEKDNTSELEMNRRGFIKAGLLVAVASIVPCDSFAAVKKLLSDERKLSIYNVHYKEHLDIVYWKDGKYVPEALAELNHIFRDHYNGAERKIKKDLFDLLYSVQKKLGCDEPFHLISGYRTRKTNAMLSRKNKGVSRKSLHIRGMAVDLRVPGVKLKTLRKTAYQVRGGGVGYYPRSNFVHLDVGQVRFWRG